MARGRAERPPLRRRARQPRSALPGKPFAGNGLARPRGHAPIDRGFADFEPWRDAILEQEERDRHKLDRKLAAEADWLRYGVTARRKRNQRRVRALDAMRAEFREQRRAAGLAAMTLSDAELSGKLVVEAKAVSKSFDGKAIVARSLASDPARRPARDRRPERRRQDDAPEPPHRRRSRPTPARSGSAPISAWPPSTSAANR